MAMKSDAFFQVLYEAAQGRRGQVCKLEQGSQGMGQGVGQEWGSESPHPQPRGRVENDGAGAFGKPNVIAALIKSIRGIPNHRPLDMVSIAAALTTALPQVKAPAAGFRRFGRRVVRYGLKTPGLKDWGH